MSRTTFLSLLLVSAGVGLVGSLPGVFLAILMVLAFPLITFTEVIIDPRSHNIWPLEMMVYAALFPVALAGAYVGRIARWGIAKSVEVSRM